MALIIESIQKSLSGKKIQNGCCGSHIDFVAGLNLHQKPSPNEVQSAKKKLGFILWRHSQLRNQLFNQLICKINMWKTNMATMAAILDFQSAPFEIF